VDQTPKSKKLTAFLIGGFAGFFAMAIVLIFGADLIMKTWP
jgi:hypothetical protein